jgi:cytochrome c oxidase subunit 2
VTNLPGASRSFRSVSLMAVVAASLCAGCMPTVASEEGREFASMWAVFSWGGLAICALVAVLTTWALVRYRHTGGALPKQTEGNVGLELTWTILPLLVVFGLFVLTFRSFSIVGPASPRAGDVELDVMAFRWGWQFSYRGQGLTITSEPGTAPEVVLPVGRTVHVTLSSRDVIHGFFIPGFLFKRDAIPGRVSTFDVTIAAPGDYGGECAEYCGLFHDAMAFTIHGVSSAEYDAWLLGRARGAAPSGSPS